MENERRKTMDTETRNKFDEVTVLLNEINLNVESNLSYQKGLDLKNRMMNTEVDIINIKETKASWYGLYLAIGLIITIITVVVVVIQVIK